MGKFLAAFTVACALLMGGAVYYLQVYYYYEEVAATGPEDVRITTRDGVVQDFPHTGFQAIDASSSPIRYRACFVSAAGTPDMSDYQPYPSAQPLEGPGWFDCYDAEEVGEALEEGRAQAFLGEKDVVYGIDRIVALFPDGRGFVWHQINHCGEVVFDGQPAPEGCAPPPPQ